MGWLWRGLNGEEDLWGLVWIYGILLVVICYAAGIAIRLFTNIEIDSPASAAGGALRYIEIFYSLWMMGAVWRCAFNTSWKISAYLARLLVLVYAVVFCFLSYTQKRALAPQELYGAMSLKLLAKVIVQLHLGPAVQYAVHLWHSIYGKYWLHQST